MGGGLISVPLAGICSGFALWLMSRRRCLEELKPTTGEQARGEVGELLSVVWPNSWRAGLKIGSEYVANVSLMSLCSTHFGLGVAAQYGLSIQLLGILQQLAGVWTQVKWPVAGQLRAQKRLADMRRLLWSRAWLQNVTFAVGAAVLVVVAEPLLRLVRIQKDPLSPGLFALLAVNHFLYLRFAFWVYLIATDNRLPSLWPTVVTNVVAVAGTMVLIRFFDWGIEAVVVAPLVAGLLFNYWYWMLAGARELGTTWWRFLWSPAGAREGA
jgi:O-antigen/teichoic acid export membrane protein